MDPISHYMIAFTIGRKRALEKAALMGLTLGAVLPDIDSISIVFGPEVFAGFHGTYTHSIPVGLLLALIFAIPFYLHYRKNVVGYIFIGLLLHLALDVVNMLSPVSPRTLMPLLPFSDFGIVIPQLLPYTTVLWALSASIIFVISIYFLIRYVKLDDHPWRIWIDERPILKKLRSKK